MLRKAGIVTTLTCLLVGGIVVLYCFINMTQHARVDSEGGTFVHGMAMLFYLTATMNGILVGSIMWGVGIRKVSGSVAIKRIEVRFQRIFFVVSSLWVGLVIYCVLVSNV